MGLGVFIEAYLFEVCCIPYIVSFDPSMHFLKLKLHIYEIIFVLKDQKRISSVLLPIQNRCNVSGQILSLTISYWF